MAAALDQQQQDLQSVVQAVNALYHGKSKEADRWLESWQKQVQNAGWVGGWVGLFEARGEGGRSRSRLLLTIL